MFVTPIDGKTEPFGATFTRVPCVGEMLFREDKCYLVVRVYHDMIDQDGYATLGEHGYLDVEEIPEPEVPQLRRKPPRRLPRKTRRRGPRKARPPGTLSE